jgi:putative effector of murein hydrolase
MLLSSPLFGILLTIVCYAIGTGINRRTKSPLANPMAIASVLLILVILSTPLTLEQYLAGGNIIILFIGPVTVILALRIWRQREELKANIIPILGGCAAGSAASLLSVWFLCGLFGLDGAITGSLLPKSVTTAIALELSRTRGGLAGLTVSAVVITGIVSSVFAPFLIKIFRLKDPVAAGVAMGASGHAIGTAAAIELGETQGAMSGIAIGIMGIFTSLIYMVFL